MSEARATDRAELIGGRERRQISIVSYDASWPVVFEVQRERIAAALGGRAVRIDHVGSTAVPGLVAKPIVDVQLSVADLGDDADYVPALLDAGYELRVREPGHLMLRTAERDVHLHVCGAGSEWERRHLLFRDWLRVDADDRRLYGETKCELAARDWPDMNAYAVAKTEVVEAVTARAERWALETSWQVDRSG